MGVVSSFRSCLPGRVVTVYWGKNVDCHTFSDRYYLHSSLWVNGILNGVFKIVVLGKGYGVRSLLFFSKAKNMEGLLSKKHELLKIYMWLTKF